MKLKRETYSRETTMDKLLLTPKDAAAALSISERTLWQLTKDGTIPAVRLRRSVRYDVGALRAWLDRQQQTAPAAALPLSIHSA
jgi:excisionase family DNA binding protein